MSEQPLPVTPAQRSAARVAAIAFPVSFAAIAYANFGIRGALLATDDAAKKLLIVDAGAALFRFSVVFDVAFCIGFIALAAALYVVLSPVNQYLALLASISKLVHVMTAVLMALGVMMSVRIASDPAYLQGLGAAPLQAMFELNSWAAWDYYYVGLIFWALSSTLFGWLWLQSRYIPPALAIFGVISSAWCLFCAVAYVANPAFSNVVNVWFFDVPMVLYYIAVSFWLLFKGLPPPLTRDG